MASGTENGQSRNVIAFALLEMNQIFVNIGKGCCIVFWKAIFAQIKWMGKQKEAIATFYILLLLCLMNYVDNVLGAIGGPLGTVFLVLRCVPSGSFTISYCDFPRDVLQSF